jgi:murein DD-endopeptidase MepM/ murein hydrolase activator NlpD
VLDTAGFLTLGVMGMRDQSAPRTATGSSPSAASEPAFEPPALPARYVFPVADCPVSYQGSHHDYPATDIFAAAGCSFVAPVAGTIDEVGKVDRWRPATNRGDQRGGRYVSLVGTDGVRYYGSHLQAVAAGIAPGEQVHEGQVLGFVGNSGNAEGVGNHLHFGISWPTPPGKWWIRRGVVPPVSYLDAWRAGRNKSPARAVAAARRAAGTLVPKCQVDC